jgi:hypothetical protein
MKQIISWEKGVDLWWKFPDIVRIHHLYTQPVFSGNIPQGKLSKISKIS